MYIKQICKIINKDRSKIPMQNKNQINNKEEKDNLNKE